MSIDLLNDDVNDLQCFLDCLNWRDAAIGGEHREEACVEPTLLEPRRNPADAYRYGCQGDERERSSWVPPEGSEA
jgi:hypothetical protein